MLRSVETVNRNMNILQKKLENTSANISNVNTPGYKFQNIIQSTMQNETLINFSGGRNNEERQELGGFVFGNQIDEVYKNFNQGILHETFNDTDMAIVGNGFFLVELNDGVGLTRNGNFLVNNEGLLTTLEGYPVLGVDNFGNMTQINVNNNFNIDNRGNISGQGTRLFIADVPDYQALETRGETIYIADNYYAIEPEVRQGFLELSNVNPANELVRMIEISREFESNQKILKSMDETLRATVNEIGKV